MFNADVPEEDITGAIQRIEEKYQSDDFSFQLFKSAGGYQFLTKPSYQTSIGIMLKQQSKKRLSTSAMETLSIIAYKQPISKSEIENIRGVNCDYAVQKLLDKGLIEITGKAETLAVHVYGTTSKFMEYFGINDFPNYHAKRICSRGEFNRRNSRPRGQLRTKGVRCPAIIHKVDVVGRQTPLPNQIGRINPGRTAAPAVLRHPGRAIRKNPGKRAPGQLDQKASLDHQMPRVPEVHRSLLTNVVLILLVALLKVQTVKIHEAGQAGTPGKKKHLLNRETENFLLGLVAKAASLGHQMPRVQEMSKSLPTNVVLILLMSPLKLPAVKAQEIGPTEAREKRRHLLNRKAENLLLACVANKHKKNQMNQVNQSQSERRSARMRADLKNLRQTSTKSSPT